MLNTAKDSFDKLIAGEEVRITYKYISEDDLKDFYHLLVLLFHQYDQIFLTEVAFTIAKEVLMNAVKANAKRLFFQRSKLNISDPEQYSKGMESFTEEVTVKWPEQEAYLTQSELAIYVILKIDNGTIRMVVENTAPVLPQEQQRILIRMEKAKGYNDLSDAFMDMGDTTESAGLGIILTQILLRNSGIGTENFNLEFFKDKTAVSLYIPNNVRPLITNSKFNEKILDEIENLPALPHTITKLIDLCGEPDSNIQKISTEIEKDPGLSADLLKLSNSAFFVTRNKVNTVLAAVKVVGLKNLKNLLYVTGVNKILNSRYHKAQEIWDHSAKCSFFARSLAMETGKSKLADIASTAGLLHDIGKLVLLSLGKEITQKIEDLKDREKSNSVLMEEYSIGISHPEIAGLLLEKWSFSEDLISIAKFHHKPFMAPDEHKDIVELVYLANMMVDVVDMKVSFGTIYTPVLKKFNLEDEKVFHKTVEKLNLAFSS
jgi:HD-like signal output (HDOD) protein